MKELILILFGILVGYFIAWLASDELVVGRKWFKLLTILSFILSFIFYDKRYITWSLIFIAVVSGVSYFKSYKK